jgi:hypothetical protein
MLVSRLLTERGSSNLLYATARWTNCRKLVVAALGRSLWTLASFLDFVDLCGNNFVGSMRNSFPPANFWYFSFSFPTDIENKSLKHFGARRLPDFA